MKRKKTFCKNFLNFKVYLAEIDKTFYKNLLNEKEIDIINEAKEEKICDYQKFSKTLFEFDNLLKYFSKKEINKIIEKNQRENKEEPSYQIEFLSHTIKLKDILDKIIKK